MSSLKDRARDRRRLNRRTPELVLVMLWTLFGLVLAYLASSGATPPRCEPTLCLRDIALAAGPIAVIGRRHIGAVIS